MAVFFIVLTVLMALVLYFDATKYIIPNWLVGLTLAVYPLMVVMSPTPIDWSRAVLATVAVFVVGYGMWKMRWMGGGDIKLITACSLWAGASLLRLFDFLIIMTVFGGVLALAAIVIRKGLPWVAPAMLGSPKLPRLFKDGEPVPYGLAIALAFLFLLWKQQLPGLTLK